MEISDATINEHYAGLSADGLLPPWEVIGAYFILAGDGVTPSAFVRWSEPGRNGEVTWTVLGLRGQVLVYVEATGPAEWRSGPTHRPKVLASSPRLFASARWCRSTCRLRSSLAKGSDGRAWNSTRSGASVSATRDASS